MRRLLLLGVTLLCAGMAIAATNINTATRDQLAQLPGIDAVKAQAIVDHRAAKGDFRTIDDIRNVKGIDAPTFDRIKGEIAVSGRTNAPASAAAPMAAPTKAEPAPAPMKAEPATAPTKAEPATTGK
jgi:competence protein ComEA